MKIPTPTYTRLAGSVAALLIAQGASADIASDLHPRGLFYTPQAGLDAPVPRTPSDATGFKEHTHLQGSISTKYDDNIFLSNTNEESDIITSVSATLRYESAGQGAAENTISVAYSPSYSIYADNSDRNSLGHALSIRIGKEMPKTTIGFTLNYSKTNGSNRFASGQIDHGQLDAGLSVSHILTGKTTLNLSLGYSFDNFGNGALFDNNSYNVRLALSYQATGKISIGPYVSYSNTDVADGGGSFDQGKWSTGVNVTYEITGKTAITGRIGYTSNSFAGASRSEQNDLSWVIGVSHKLTEKTSLRASFYRDYKVSYTFEDAGYQATGVALSASHAYSERLSLFATFTYENDDYFRADDPSYKLVSDYYAITVGGRYVVNERLSLGANLTYRKNDDTFSMNEFNNFSAGLSASYTFW